MRSSGQYTEGPRAAVSRWAKGLFVIRCRRVPAHNGRQMTHPVLRLLQRARRAADALLRAGLWLVLPLALLLAAQWPLRDGLGRWSREANDLAQCLFALYVAAALLHASRHGAHVAIDALAQRWPAFASGRLTRLLTAVLLLPWALFTAVVGWPMAAQSLAQLEGFPESDNPGYFAIKLAMWLLAAGVAWAALADLLPPDTITPDA